jgi:hypothetical protein|tara:strand:- start:5275 stop:5541 length:267 start_codon:yes stop_codon:yes gene_type:complete
MNLSAEIIDAVETAAGNCISIGYMVTVVSKFFAGRDAWGLTDDLIAFDDHLIAIAVFDYPFASQERDGVFRGIADAHEIHEGVGFIHG